MLQGGCCLQVTFFVALRIENLHLEGGAHIRSNTQVFPWLRPCHPMGALQPSLSCDGEHQRVVPGLEGIPGLAIIQMTIYFDRTHRKYSEDNLLGPVLRSQDQR